MVGRAGCADVGRQCVEGARALGFPVDYGAWRCGQGQQRGGKPSRSVCRLSVATEDRDGTHLGTGIGAVGS